MPESTQQSPTDDSAPRHRDPGADTFRLLFERSTDPIFLFDPATGTFEDANDAAVNLLRCGTKQRLLDLKPADWSPEIQPDGRPSGEAAAAFGSEINRLGGTRFEWLARRADGAELPLEIVATAIEIGGRTLHTVVARDISERKAAAAALSESREILASVADNIYEGIYRSDASHALIFVNNAYLRMFGYSSLAELQAVPRETLYARPSDRPRLLERLSRDGGFDQQEIEYIRRDGSRFWGLSSSHVIRDPKTGAVAYHVGAIADITDNTERKRRERIQQATYLISEAAHAADDLPALYHRIHEIVGNLMPARNFFIALYTLETGLITFPYFRDEFGDEPPDPRPIETGLTGAVLRSGTPLLLEGSVVERGRRADGIVVLEGVDHLQYIECGRPAAVWLGVPLKTQGRTVGAMVVQDYHDPSAYGETEKQILAYVGTQTALAIERKRSQQALYAALEREKELGVLKSNFVSMVSHEFRTPLGIIMSSAGILEKYFDRLDPAERREQLASIQRSTRRMGNLMEEVLLLARLDAGRISFEPRPIDLAALCHTVAEDVAAVTIGHCPISVSVQAGSDQPIGSADERLLRNIFTNLLTNAVKYSDAGSPVELALRREGYDAVVTVNDRGIGIPEADRAWLFHAFHRGRNVGSRAGTGLGLVIVQRCLELHGGTIHIDSTVGRGTMITLRIPVFPPSPDLPFPPAGN